MALIGDEVVYVYGVSPTGDIAAYGEPTTTQDIADLGGGGGGSSFVVVGCEMDAATTSGLTYGYKAGVTHRSDGVFDYVSAGTVNVPDDTVNVFVFAVLNPNGSFNSIQAGGGSSDPGSFIIALFDTAGGQIVNNGSQDLPIAPAQTFQPVLGSGVSQDLDPVNFNGCVLTTDGLMHDNVVNLPLITGNDALNLNGKVYTISPVFTDADDTVFVTLAGSGIEVYDPAGTLIGYTTDGLRFGSSPPGGSGINFRLGDSSGSGAWQYIGNQQPSNLTPSVGYVPVDGVFGQALVNNSTPGGAWGNALKATPGDDFSITGGDGSGASLTGGDDTGTGAGNAQVGGGPSFTDGIPGGNGILAGGEASIGNADGGNAVIVPGVGAGTGRFGRVTIDNATSAPGASAGTLLNAPSAGDPAIWLEIVINGVTYYFPGWTA